MLLVLCQGKREYLFFFFFAFHMSHSKKSGEMFLASLGSAQIPSDMSEVGKMKTVSALLENVI